MENLTLIQIINDCAVECEKCATACLNEKEVHMLAVCIMNDRDCADICRLTATLLARNSEHAKHMIPECIEMCKKCAAECEKHNHMEHCKKCADACLKCMEACKNMAA
jgi:hypothetical protein